MNGTTRLRQEGVSLWLDGLSRDDLLSGRLAELVGTHGVTGVTTNPTIFAKAVGGHRAAYADQLRALASSWTGEEEAALAVITHDVRAACDVLLPVHTATGGADGFVSVEVRPAAAHDAEATLAEVRRLRRAVDRPNLLVKIPATSAGVRALEAATAEGSSINMTLLFDRERYREVRAAYERGLRRAREAGIPPAGIHSVASFFVSRVDTEADARLATLHRPEAEALRGRAAVANTRLAYAEWEASLADPSWQELAAAGANVQRPLWASLGVKDPAMRDTRYVEDLVAPSVIDTMPLSTLEAVADHAAIHGDTIHGGIEEAREVLAGLERLDVSLSAIAAGLERTGIADFGSSWEALVDAVTVRGADALR